MSDQPTTIEQQILEAVRGLSEKMSAIERAIAEGGVKTDSNAKAIAEVFAAIRDLARSGGGLK